MTAFFRPTRLTVDYGTIKENARLLRDFYGDGVRMMAVVKADAYGHGACRAAKAALDGGADRLAVAVVDEAVELREAGIDAPILVLGGTYGEGVFEGVRIGAELLLQDPAEASEMREAAKKLQRPALSHIKIDTGMTRLGVKGDGELETLLSAIGADGAIRVTGAFTHYCDPLDREFTFLQHGAFARKTDRVRAAGYAPLAHGAATEASLLYPETWDDCVRPGIALYGGCADMLPGLRWAMRLTSKPVRIERIESGETVGYGRTFLADRPTVVMTVPVGYADGYPRLLGGRAQALVRGFRAPVIGRVCMDMLMLDVTDVPGVSMRDEVVLLGSQGRDEITPDEMAAWAQTLSYEIITGFHGRIARGDTDDKGGNPRGDTR